MKTENWKPTLRHTTTEEQTDTYLIIQLYLSLCPSLSISSRYFLDCACPSLLHDCIPLFFASQGLLLRNKQESSKILWQTYKSTKNKKLTSKSETLKNHKKGTMTNKWVQHKWRTNKNGQTSERATISEQQSSKRETSEGHKRKGQTSDTYTSERQLKKEPDKNAANKSETNKWRTNKWVADTWATNKRETNQWDTNEWGTINQLKKDKKVTEKQVRYK